VRGGGPSGRADLLSLLGHAEGRRLAARSFLGRAVPLARDRGQSSRANTPGPPSSTLFSRVFACDQRFGRSPFRPGSRPRSAARPSPFVGSDQDDLDERVFLRPALDVPAAGVRSAARQSDFEREQTEAVRWAPARVRARAAASRPAEVADRSPERQVVTRRAAPRETDERRRQVI
jgi:hypothetical protein